MLQWSLRENDRIRSVVSAVVVDAALKEGVPRVVQESFAPMRRARKRLGVGRGSVVSRRGILTLRACAGLETPITEESHDAIDPQRAEPARRRRVGGINADAVDHRAVKFPQD